MYPAQTRGPSGAMKFPYEQTEVRLPVNWVGDVRVARQVGRRLAIHLRFTLGDATDVATVVSELARNIVTHAQQGEITFTPVEDGSRYGLLIRASDKGPGISNVDQALQKGYSTSDGLGLGLCGVKQVTDEFEIASEPGKGTVVTATKWRRR